LLPSDTPLDLPDFLRRLYGLLTGGWNAEMLALGECEIEDLRQRWASDTESSRLESEIRRLQAEVTDSKVRAAQLAADMKTHIGELNARTKARIAELVAEVEELRGQQGIIDETIAVVPVEQLRLARAQFDCLARGFAKSGDVISLTICQIGACAIDKALGSNDCETKPLPGAVVRET
jgi:predicted RNase H-like nuclease (RuvC/YqgF family)